MQKTEFVIDRKFAEETKDSFYNRYYAEISEEFVKWRSFGAVEKTKSILELCRGLTFGRVVEVGAGLCDLLVLLGEANFGSEYYVLEVSSSAVQFVRDNMRIPRLKAVYLLDTCATPFSDNFFDLGILSHVLEHVVDPAKLLKETLRICKYVVVEVPLENCVASNFYAHLKRNQSNPAGHVNFFSKQSVKHLVTANNAAILKDRNYRSKQSWTRNPLSMFKSAFFHLLFKLTGSKIVASHYAMLISSFPQRKFSKFEHSVTKQQET